MMINTYRLVSGSLVGIDAGFFTFPAGEWSFDPNCIASGDHIVVDVRGSATDDLLKAREVAQGAHARGARATLLLPYLPAARSDHDEVMGVMAYAAIVRDAFDEVVTIDPHSPVGVAAYGATVADHTELVIEALNTQPDFAADLAGVIAADKSGSAHAARTAEALGVEMFQALKHRDPTTGALSGFSCDPLPDHGTFLVVDDICDGGGTFLGLADVAGVEASRMGLWVTHGVFSGSALDRLSSAFSWIASSDSFRTLNVAERSVCHQVPVLDTLVRSVAPRL